ncbi:FecR family protein [Pedobacter paludis]|uniref:Anti-sigma factor n=1 Tax=Pedobacter paludis TaxID=2203212 RepID=A0A317EY27_9SPHI|nr:FecR family protein [Pedobacter paludis]PWS30589.1 anti-sigma factor [Pedobacter paludis]
MNAFNNKKELQKIIERYVSGEATAEEILFVEEYYNYLTKNENVLDSVSQAELTALEESNFKAIQSKISGSKRHKIIPFLRYVAAAVILLLVSSTLYFALNRNRLSTANNLTKNKVLDVLPGTDKAILTLSDGSKVVLDNQTASNISDRDGLKISKTKDGQLIYTILNQENLSNKKAIAYNTIQTPKGGQYQIILPDGTKVWLNAASTLKYPEVFVGNERRVELTGEAYFEVAKNKAMPFHVKNESQDVEVLGTHFNINGYMDEKTIKTTLLEGSVKVSNGKSSKILKPGDQSIAGISENSSIQLVHNIDTDDETAWKNGLFQFSNEGLKTILNQLERWYDIKIDYSSVPDKRYNGMVPRKAKLSEVLKMLELTGNIKFEIVEGRQLKVLQEK